MKINYNTNTKLAVMNKCGNDAKVKKSLVRNSELKLSKNKETVIPDMGCNSNTSTEMLTIKRNELNQPTLCSSEALANYLTEVKVTVPTSVTCKELNPDIGDLSGKITKKLNFHFDDRMYKNLIELNANNAEVKKKKEKRVLSNNTKRDLEPNMEDFYQVETDRDVVQNIPVIRPKFKPIKKVDNGRLHKLIASFEDS